MTLLVGYYALKESLKKLEVLNMFGSFTGVLFIIACSSGVNQRGSDVTVLAHMMGIGANGLSALIFALGNVIIRKLKNLDTIAVSAMHATVSFALSLILFLVYRLFINPNAFTYNLTYWQMIMIVGNGLIITASSFLYIKAF